MRCVETGALSKMEESRISSSTPLQCISEHIMLARALNLCPANIPHHFITLRTDRTLRILLIALFSTSIQASLVEAMFTQEMHSREI